MSAGGDLANWHTGEPDAIPAVGGAMDLAAGARHVFVMMEHLTKGGESKIVASLTYLLIALASVAGIYTDPRHVIHYTSNDEVRQEFTVVYRAEYVSGEPTTSSETTQVEWVPVDKIPDLNMDRSQKMRLDWALNHNGTWIDPAGN